MRPIKTKKKLQKDRNTKNKIINHLIKNGKKKTNEKLLLKCFKELQKTSKKTSKKLVQLTLIHFIYIFKLYTFTNKKNKKRKKILEVPSFITNEKARISLAIKFVLQNMVKKKFQNYYQQLKQEILLNAQTKSDNMQIKYDVQKRILLLEHLLKKYRW